MEIISKVTTFMKNGEKKTTILNMIKKVFIEVNQNLQEKVAYFCNERHCFGRYVIQHVAQYSNELLNDHEEADAKLVALLKR